MPTIQVVKPSASFTMIPNVIIRNKEISMGAVGLYSYLASLPPGASTTLKRLADSHTDGLHAVRRFKDELVETGFLKVEQENTGGTFGAAVWFLADKPGAFPGQSELPLCDFPTSAKPSNGSPNIGKSNANINTNDQDKTSLDKTALGGLVAAWNAMAEDNPGIQPVIRLTKGERKTHAETRLKDPVWAENYPKALAQIPKRKWRLGINDRKWFATFEWFVRPDTLGTLLEEMAGDAKAGKHDKAIQRDGEAAGAFRI